MKGVEFVRRVRALARRSGLRFRFVASHGKGSHGTLYVGGRLTTVPDLRREIPTGTLHAMVKQLGLEFAELAQRRMKDV